MCMQVRVLGIFPYKLLCKKGFLIKFGLPFTTTTKSFKSILNSCKYCTNLKFIDNSVMVWFMTNKTYA